MRNEAVGKLAVSVFPSILLRGKGRGGHNQQIRPLSGANYHDAKTIFSFSGKLDVHCVGLEPTTSHSIN
jgi:hypothetical protein